VVCDRGENALDTVVNVKVRLFLAAIAKYAQPRWFPAQGAVEVEHMAMCVSLAKYRYDPKHDACELEPVRISSNQALAS
jgi:hypothetical protein